MNRLKQIFSILLVFTVFTAFSQDKPDAVYHKIVKEYTIHKDGSYDLHYFKKLELMSHFSFNQLYGETFIVYNPDYQDLKINESYTIMKDGKKVKTPENAFNKVLPRDVREFPAYNHLREMVVTHTGLALGATIYLDYTLSTDKEMFGGLSVKEEIKRRSPVKELEIIVHAPADMDIFHKVQNLRTAPETSEKEGTKTYRWLFKDVKPFPNEGNICEDSKPAIYLQSGSKGVEKEIDVENLDLKLPKAFREKVTELAKEEESAVDKVNAIKDYVVKQIDYSRVDQESIGNKIRSFKEIYETNVASHPEKIFLVSAMIRETGLSAYPVLVYPEGKLPVLSDNHQIKLKVDFKKDAPYVCGLNDKQNLWYGMEGKVFRPLAKGKTGQVTKFPDGNNRYDFNGEMIVEGKKASLEADLELTHYLNPYSKFGTSSQKYTSVINGLEVDTAIVSNPTMNGTKLTLKTHSPKEIAKEARELRMIELPAVNGGVDSWDLGTLFDDRITSYEIPFTLKENYRMKVDIRDGNCINEDVKEEIDASFGSVSVQLKNNGDSVVITRKVSLNKTCFNPIEYQQLRKMLRIYTDEKTKKIVIR